MQNTIRHHHQVSDTTQNKFAEISSFFLLLLVLLLASRPLLPHHHLLELPLRQLTVPIFIVAFKHSTHLGLKLLLIHSYFAAELCFRPTTCLAVNLLVVLSISCFVMNPSLFLRNITAHISKPGKVHFVLSPPAG